MIELKNALPGYFTDIYEVDAILKAVSNEINRLYDVMERAFANLSASSSTSAFERWEDDLGLSHYGTDSERRQAILARLGLMRTQTIGTVMSLIGVYAKGVTGKVTEKGDTVLVEVEETGNFTEFRQLIAQIKNALPYHLNVEFSSKSYLETGYMNRRLSVCDMELDFTVS